jgi:peptide-methionine (S)-S-oxide reductase
MKLLILACVVGALVAAFGLTRQDEKKEPTHPNVKGAKALVIGGGCFWCLDGMYRELEGVLDVESGYAGGNKAGVSYEEVSSGETGHAEVVKITYDPKVISADDILRIFFTVHNPTTPNQQGPDYGTQYRSVIFYSNDEEKKLGEKIMAEVEKAKIWDAPLVTTIEPLKNYTKAEDYHQDYFEKFQNASPIQKMSMNSGYCSAIIAPKVIHFRELYAKKLKKKH